jgi:hypothetical protein
MSKEKAKENSWGGPRKGAGRPEGQTKEKISISVDRDTLSKALKKWGGKKSPLIEKLLQDYAK